MSHRFKMQHCMVTALSGNFLLNTYIHEKKENSKNLKHNVNLF